ncbi:hypothetical protein WJX73_007530 [Symbiochloris irregularis]|uniref:Acetyl-coenzyme A transporter 1 n=1 Tax=Symbiochloris irregularis TaxID=706552 RepID=A0AAW1PIE0_9CHLO
MDLAAPKRRRLTFGEEDLLVEEGKPQAHRRRNTLSASGSQDFSDGDGKEDLRKDAGNMALLTVLYLMQGVPLGLTSGAMPFVLQAKASYTQIGVFSLATYPYSFKLFWSPIVDSVYSLRMGRRKSWVVPIQLASGALMLLQADWAERKLEAADVASVTGLFFVLVLLAATQDIAVDGWALTLLSRRNVGWAATCQTVGMNIGYFSSFTVFLALNDASFCNKYLRSAPSTYGVLRLGDYMRFWGWAYIGITLALLFFKREKNFKHAGPGSQEAEEASEGLTEAYRQLWGVIKLPAVRRLSIVLLLFRLGMLPAEQAGPLKLLEKGVSKEALAGLVLLEFPCELLSALVAGRWAARTSPFNPFLKGFFLRLCIAALLTVVVYQFPSGAESLGSHPLQFAALAACGVLTSFTSTLMFTSLGSFFNRISDPAMGGAYLTLLNTIANMGVILPKLGIFALIDALTSRQCKVPSHSAKHPMELTFDASILCPRNKVAAEGDNDCTRQGGQQTEPGLKVHVTMT